MKEQEIVVTSEGGKSKFEATSISVILGVPETGFYCSVLWVNWGSQVAKILKLCAISYGEKNS